MLIVAATSIAGVQGSTLAQITTLGTDTAKHVFPLHRVDVHGNVVLHKRVSRTQVALNFEQCVEGKI